MMVSYERVPTDRPNYGSMPGLARYKLNVGQV